MEIIKLRENGLSNTFLIVEQDKFLLVDPSSSIDEVRDEIGEFQILKREDISISMPNYSQNDMHSTLHSTQNLVFLNNGDDKTQNKNSKILQWGNNSIFPPKDNKILSCVGVFVTHCHFDHIYYIEEWAHAGAVVLGSEQAFWNMQDININASKMFSEKSFVVDRENCVFVKDCDKLNLNGAQFTILQTTGHTNCSISLWGANRLFCGDLIFAGGYVGRTDLPTGSAQELDNSLEKINKLPKPLTVYSGHGDTFLL